MLQVAKSGLYAWLYRIPSPRTEAAQRLRAQIQEIFQQSRGTSGSPRVHAELLERGHAVSRARIGREMRSLAWSPGHPRGSG